jgi:hypothetical protein
MLSQPLRQNEIDEDSPEVAGWRRFFDERIELVMSARGFDRAAAEAQAHQILVVEWINRRPIGDPAAPNNCCCWCGVQESDPADLRPYGTDVRGVAWLHPDRCWKQWSEKRRAEAVVALRKMGIAEPTP